MLLFKAEVGLMEVYDEGWLMTAILFQNIP